MNYDDGVDWKYLIFDRNENGEWEDLEIAPLSQPPELPEVMRQQEQTNNEAA